MLLDDAQEVGLAENDVLGAIDINFGAAELAVNDGVAGLDGVTFAQRDRVLLMDMLLCPDPAGRRHA